MRVPDISEVGYVGTCPNCGFALWLDPGSKRTVMCVCGGLVINKDGLDDRSSVSPQPVNAVLLQEILAYEYAEDPTEMTNPQQAAVDARKRRR